MRRSSVTFPHPSADGTSALASDLVEHFLPGRLIVGLYTQVLIIKVERDIAAAPEQLEYAFQHQGLVTKYQFVMPAALATRSRMTICRHSLASRRARGWWPRNCCAIGDAITKAPPSLPSSPSGAQTSFRDPGPGTPGLADPEADPAVPAARWSLI
jgi:hypothetical protein